MRDALSKVKLKLDRSDPTGASLQFFADVVTDLRRNRVSHATEDAPKAIISQMANKIEPSVIRETIEQQMEYWAQDKEDDFRCFQENVSAASTEAAKFLTKDPELRTQSRQRSRLKRSRKEATQTMFLHRGMKILRRWRKTLRATLTVQHSMFQMRSGRDGTNTARRNLDGLSTVSTPSARRIRHCKNTSPEKEEELLREHYESKGMEYPSKKKKGKNKGKIASTKHSKLCDGRWEIFIEGKLKYVSLRDIGADFSAFPRSFITALD